MANRHKAQKAGGTPKKGAIAEKVIAASKEKGFARATGASPPGKSSNKYARGGRSPMSSAKC